MTQELLEKTSFKNLKVILSPRNFASFSKLFWLFSYAISLSGFSYYIYTSFLKLHYDPEIIKSTREVDPDNFSFPAITICPNIFVKDFAANFTKTKYNDGSYNYTMTEEECFAIMANTQWCDPFLYLTVKRFGYCENYKYDEIDVIQKIRETAYVMDYGFGVGIYPGFLSRDLLTQHGVCLSINLMDLEMIYASEAHKDLIQINKIKIGNETEPVWTPEKGFKTSSLLHLWKVSTGKVVKVSLPLSAKDAENACGRKHFKVFLHKPNEIVTGYHTPIYVNHDEIFSATVTVKSLRTDEALRSFSTDIRKCYFEGERKLRFFKTYTKALCELECAANLTLKKCGCVWFSMPRDESTKVCNASMNRMSFCGYQKFNCKCYAPCIDVEYTYAIDRQNHFNKQVPQGFPRAATVAQVIIQIDQLMETVEEIENLLSYKTINFIADFGGFLGLFLGASLISIMETFYFAFRNFRSSKRKVSQEQEEANQRAEDRKTIRELVEKMATLEKKLNETCTQSSGDNLSFQGSFY